jgi:hypothetical protein
MTALAASSLGHQLIGIAPTTLLMKSGYAAPRPAQARPF